MKTLHPLFQTLDASRVHVPDAEEGARKAIRQFEREGRPVLVDWRKDGTVLVAPAGLEPLLLVTDPAVTSWDAVTTS